MKENEISGNFLIDVQLEDSFKDGSGLLRDFCTD